MIVDPRAPVGSWRRGVAVAAAGLAASVSAQTAPPPPPLPPVDLGQTNILDGEGKPGALLEIIGSGSIANRLTDDQGDRVPGRNRQRIATAIVHPIFVSKVQIAGAHPGVELLLPLSRVENDFSGPGAGSHTGLGDVTVAPFLQWAKADPGPGSVSARLGLQVVAPVGDHDPGRAVNTGQGGWQLSPYLAATWRPSARWELSGRAIYDWSGPAGTRRPDGVRLRAQPGDLAALDLSTSYEVSSAWRLGIGGYALRQLGDARDDGTLLPGRRERVYGIGPVSRLQMGRTTLLAAAYGEFGARNRPEGVTINVRLQRPF